MNNSATEYQKKTLILSIARNRVYLTTNSDHKLFLNNKERKHMETEKFFYWRSTSPINLTQESCNCCDCIIELMKNTNGSVSSDTRFFNSWSSNDPNPFTLKSSQINRGYPPTIFGSRFNHLGQK
jgi:hypothetical protein